MKTNQLISISVFLLILLVTQSGYAQSKEDNIKNSIEYFHKRNEALSLAQSQNWLEVIPIVEELIQYYQKDGDLFYILGLSYYETKHYQKAIRALKQTLDLGGTILVVPAGSRPSNDIMIKIAKAYGFDGDKENAIIWLKKGFASRYDEKFYLKQEPAFSAFQKDEDFRQLFGMGNQADITRTEAWTSDLNYLQKRIIELHYALDDVITEKNFNTLFEELKSSIRKLSDEQIVVEIMKIMGSLGSGHNFIIPTSSKVGALKKLPIQIYQFADGMYIVDAEEGFEKWIGFEVEKIGNTSIEDALLKTNLVNARDNEMQTLWQGPYFLSMPDVLKGIGIIENEQQVTITLSDCKGKSQKLTLEPISWNFTGFPKIPPLKKESQPLYLSKMNDIFWYESILENQAIYIQFNSVQNKNDQTLKNFTLEIQNQIDQKNPEFLILDLRHNSGGNGAIRNHMLKLLIKFEANKPEGKIFVLMGRRTYSAAQNLLTEISIQTNAILVGEPSSSKPSFVGEAGWFQLPNSGIIGIAASQYHKSSEAEDFRKWIAPHIPVILSSKDYFSGNDKALDIIFEVINTSEIRNKN
jgi:tetratricopeptide (TPR) repeat protein